MVGKSTIKSNYNNIRNIHFKRRSANPFIMILLFLFLISTAVLGWMYNKKKKQIQALMVQFEETNYEKENLTLEFNDLLEEYESLETNNDSLSNQLTAKQEEIKTILQELKRVKRINKTEVEQYKKELETLRSIMRSFVVQIDSLNTVNIALTKENKKVKTQYRQVKESNEELTKIKDTLLSTVARGSVIKAKNIQALPLNKRSKEKNKARKIEKIKVCFTLMENSIADAGKRWVFIRIARPDEIVLASTNNDFFEYEGDQIVYTARREVDYQNQDVDMCIYFHTLDELIPGTYTVDIFTDGNAIGTTSFYLK